MSLVPVGVLAILDQHATSQALVENSRQVMQNALAQSASALDHFIDANLATVRTESMIPQFAKFLELPAAIRADSQQEREVMALLMSLKRRDEINITSIALLDRHGVAVADTFGGEIGAEKSDRDYFREPMETGLPYVSTVGLTAWSQQPALYFSCPVRGSEGRILGVLRIRYNAVVLKRLLSSKTHEKGSDFKLILFDEHGIRLVDTARPDLTLTPGFPLDEETRKNLITRRHLLSNAADVSVTGQTLDVLAETAPEFFRAALHGRGSDSSLNVKTRIQSRPWTLVLGYSEVDNAERIEMQMRNALLLILGITLAVVLGSVVVARGITGPLLRLTDAAQAISKGERGEIELLNTGDEIGDLASMFNAMSQALQASRQRLLASGARLQSLLDTLPDSVLIHKEDGSIVDVNRNFEVMFGYSAQEAHTLSIEEISGGGLTQGDAIKCLESSLTQDYVMYDWISRRRDGNEFPSRIRLRKLLLPEGARIMVVLSDVTVQKNAEQAMLRVHEELEQKVAARTHDLLEANKKLLHLDELKNAFIASASHELRTPLTSVLGFAKVTGKHFEKYMLPAVRNDATLVQRGQLMLENLRIIESEGLRLSRLINDLLDLNKIESGKCEWRNELVHLPEEVFLAARTMEAEFKKKPDVHLTFDVDNNVPPLVIDRDRIRQVFLNLLSNALKFTQSGNICFRLRRDANGMIGGAIEDNGTGIPNDDQKRVFDKFYQVAPLEPGQTKSQGTGLGLSICRQIVEHYGGRIWIESELGKGCTVHFLLPLTKKHDLDGPMAGQHEHTVFV